MTYEILTARTQAWTKALLLVGLFTPLLATAGAAWTPVFKPTGLYISGEANYHLRVLGAPLPANCLPGWAYINQADNGAKTYIAAMMLAYASGKQVQLFVEPDVSGYCHIIEAIVTG